MNCSADKDLRRGVARPLILFEQPALKSATNIPGLWMSQAY